MNNKRGVLPSVCLHRFTPATNSGTQKTIIEMASYYSDNGIPLRYRENNVVLVGEIGSVEGGIWWCWREKPRRSFSL